MKPCVSAAGSVGNPVPKPRAAQVPRGPRACPLPRGYCTCALVGLVLFANCARGHLVPGRYPLVRGGTREVPGTVWEVRDAAELYSELHSEPPQRRPRRIAWHHLRRWRH
jgi:hypothetical protein